MHVLATCLECKVSQRLLKIAFVLFVTHTEVKALRKWFGDEAKWRTEQKYEKEQQQQQQQNRNNNRLPVYSLNGRIPEIPSRIRSRSIKWPQLSENRANSVLDLCFRGHTSHNRATVPAHTGPDRSESSKKININTSAFQSERVLSSFILDLQSILLYIYLYIYMYLYIYICQINNYTTIHLNKSTVSKRY